MRILLLLDCYFPVTKSAPKLMRDLGVEFQKMGHEVTVLVPAEGGSSSVAVSVEEGLRIVRIRIRKLKGTNRLLRGLREARLSYTLWTHGRHFLRKNPVDLIAFYSPSIFLGPFVRRLKRLWGCHVYLVLRDIWPRFLLDTGVLNEGLVYRYFRKRVIEEYDAADVIGVQAAGDISVLGSEFPGHRYPVEVLHNWAPLNEGPVPPSNWRRSLGLEDKVVFFYGGNFGVAQDLENILRLARVMEDEPSAFFLFVGSGSEGGRLQRAVKRLKLRNVRVHPPVAQQDFLSMVSEFDIGLVSLHRNFRIQNLPGKLMSYFAFAKPVLASVNPGNDLLQMIPAHGAGFCCVNGNDEKLRECAVALVRAPHLRARFGASGRELLIRQFSVSSAARQILAHFLEDRLFQGIPDPAIPSVSKRQSPVGFAEHAILGAQPHVGAH